MVRSPKTPQKKWLKPSSTVLLLGVGAWLSPVAPLDPWNLLSPRKIAVMVFTLGVLQAFGSVMGQYLGARTGALFTGFFGGLVSSTATTAALARKSRDLKKTDSSTELLTFLSATSAMLCEGVALVLAGTDGIHGSILVIFLVPILAAAALIVVQYRRAANREFQADDAPFEIRTLLKLSFFIVAVLLASKLLQKIFGQYGLVILTFLVSLFEIHGSVIANIQLHDSGSIAQDALGSLLAVSLLASLVSKLFLIWTLGGAHLKRRVVESFGVLFASLLLGWLISTLLV